MTCCAISNKQSNLWCQSNRTPNTKEIPTIHNIYQFVCQQNIHFSSSIFELNVKWLILPRTNKDQWRTMYVHSSSINNQLHQCCHRSIIGLLLFIWFSLHFICIRPNSVILNISKYYSQFKFAALFEFWLILNPVVWIVNVFGILPFTVFITFFLFHFLFFSPSPSNMKTND